jgi:hypothetical protein
VNFLTVILFSNQPACWRVFYGYGCADQFSVRRMVAFALPGLRSGYNNVGIFTDVPIFT